MLQISNNNESVKWKLHLIHMRDNAKKWWRTPNT